ncbi:MAG: hypothetical protein DRO00_08295 [Thermoproteota archaeon]|nr:MAG: hypothetical protein DRO00_08295 [Candidatus Korarchaeota archaeon]
MIMESNLRAIIVPRLPSGARRKEVIEKEGFSILLYLKNDVPYVKIHFPNDSSGLHDIVLKVKGVSSLEEAPKVALEELKLWEEIL